MEFFTKKEVIRKVIIAILIVMSFNFLSPTVSHADFGGALFEPISKLLCGVSDLIIQALQKYFVGVWDISYEGPGKGQGHSTGTTYYIRYSPGIIFSGKVAGLKVNFKWSRL